MAGVEGAERHFAKAYTWATRAVNQYILSLNEEDRILMQRLETEFAVYFMEGVADFKNGKPNAVWDSYFNTPDLNEAQYFLLGINAHINGDMWKALYGHFSLGELRELEHIYRQGHTALKEVVNRVQTEIVPTNRRLRTIHTVVLGLDKPIANWMLKRWRNRQFKIALQLHQQPERGQKILKRATRKMVKMNGMIIRLLI